MRLIKKYFLFLVSLALVASLGFASPDRVLAQEANEEVTPPLFSDLTWENLGNVQKDVNVYDQTLTLNGNMFEAVENLQIEIPETVFKYYSIKNLESLGWTFVGNAGFESTYWHSSGKYLTVQIVECPDSQTEYCVNIWQSADSNSTPPPSEKLADNPVPALIDFSKLSPTNGSTVALPANTYRLLTWGDAEIGSTDRYQYCIDETNNQLCDANNWLTRDSLYSGPDFTVLAGHTYYWQVRVRDANLYANSGIWWSFTIAPTTTPVFTKTTPSNGAVVIPVPTTTFLLLQWSNASISSTDRYQYCIDETNNQLCDANNWITRNSLYSGPGEFAVVTGHTYYWQVRARDANIYANSGVWWAFNAGGTIPTVSSIVRLSPSIASTNASSVSFKVTFNQNVTGVDASDFTLVTTGLSGPGINAVSGSGNVYNVTVNTGIGTGTIHLNLTDNDSINTNGIVLGGAGVGNGSFTTGETFNIVRTPSPDFNGDHKTDISVFRPSNGTWYIRGQGTFVYGAADDIPVPADYNGDGKEDIAVFRPSNGTWYIKGQSIVPYGATGDIPAVGDYNGDGKADIAYFHPGTGTWYIKDQSTFVYGTSGDIPAVGDYNGDGKTDVAVFRPSNGTWYIRGQGSFVYGTSGDKPVVGDYNGDGKADIAVFRPSNGNWYIKGQTSLWYGVVDDIPVVGDYNGDGKVDITIFRPSTGAWNINGIGSYIFGAAGDIPL